MADCTRPKRSRLFKVTSPVDRAWSLGGFLCHLMTPCSVSFSVSETLHLNPQTYFGQFRGTSAHTLAAGSRAPEGIWTLPRLTHGYCCRGRVPKISSKSSKQFGHKTLTSLTDRRWQRPDLRVAQKLSCSPARGRVPGCVNYFWVLYV